MTGVLSRLVLFVPALAAVLPVIAGETTLSDQDVVRMVVAGRSNAEIVETIRAREVRFDLTPEMLSELRLAGVPEVVLEAMRERQGSMAVPAPPAPAPAEEAEASVRILLVAEPSGKGASSAVWFPDRIEEDLARALRLGPAPEDRRVKDLAVLLACLTSEHVPDQWRSRSPLGKDFVSMPRHALLVFHAGAIVADPGDVPRSVRTSFPRPRKDEPAPGTLRLALPRELAAPIESGEKHRLLLGIAALVGDRYLLLAHAERTDVESGPDGVELRAHITQGGKKGGPLAVQLDATSVPAP